MKNKTYTLNTVLTAVLAAVLAVMVVLRAVSPQLILMQFDIVSITGISLIALVRDHYLAKGAKRCYICIPVFAALSFGILPFAAGMVPGLGVETAHETFGRGGKALTDHVFLSQFLNKTGSFEVATSGADAFSGATAEAEPAEGAAVSVDAITGATVTSKAVVRCVNSAVSFVTGADVTTEATSWGG